MANKFKAQENVEYWPFAPIIVNGIDAYKFYCANLANNNRTNKR